MEDDGGASLMSEVRTTVEILRAARARIEREEHWTKDATARDGAGFLVMSTDPIACRWCALGALHVTLGGDFNEKPGGPEAYGFLRVAAGNQPVVHFNDAPKTKHADVLAVFDNAIALAAVLT
jgi:hypothetical protein